LNNLKAIDSYFAEIAEIIKKISKDDINTAINILDNARKEGRKIFVIGNGGSASTATHFACDLNKYTSVEGEKRFRAISLEDNIPLMTALVNDEGWENVYSYQLENCWNEEWDDFISSINNNSIPNGSGFDGLKALQLAFKIYDFCKRT